MAEASAPKTKSVTFVVYMTRTPRISITYKDKHDLFEAFKKKMAELGVPLYKVLSVGGDYEPSRMNNADNVLVAGESYVGRRLYVADDADKERSMSPCCDDFADHRRGCCSTDHNDAGHPCPSNRCRGHCRFSGPSPRHHHHCHHYQNPVPACVPCSCSAWCPTMGTSCGCECSH